METLLSGIDVKSFLSTVPAPKQSDVAKLLKIFFSNVAGSLICDKLSATILAKLNANSVVAIIDNSLADFELAVGKMSDLSQYSAGDISVAYQILADKIAEHLVLISTTISGVGNVDYVIDFIQTQTLPYLQNKIQSAKQTIPTTIISQVEQSTY